MDALSTISISQANRDCKTATAHPELWQQVLSRNPNADGIFLYGVRTTGIYCRPTCPSRRPSPGNAVFFANAAEARLAGFRACLRCKPDFLETTDESVSAAVSEVAQYLATHPDQALPGRELARRVGRNRLALLREFRQALGVTPAEFARASRVARLREDLDSADSSSVTEAIYAAGFGSPSRVYERSESELGMTPGQRRNRGEGILIRYTVASSPLGLMLVAATDTGVCAILFGEQASVLEADLRRRFRKARLVRVEAEQACDSDVVAVSHRSGEWLVAAVAYVASQLTEHPIARSFPLDIRATAFQMRVWKALQAIPRGETRCYSDVAAAIGCPTSMRAVGAAIGANPLAVVVPCHRVLGKDGDLTGYHWGLDRKRTLLAAERRQGPARERR